jgi:hypothetical protein
MTQYQTMVYEAIKASGSGGITVLEICAKIKLPPKKAAGVLGGGDYHRIEPICRRLEKKGELQSVTDGLAKRYSVKTPEI